MIICVLYLLRGLQKLESVTCNGIRNILFHQPLQRLWNLSRIWRAVMQNAIGEKSPSTGKLIKHKSEQLSRWAWQTREMQLPNKIIAELIYNANTKGPRSETRGPAIGGSGPGSHRSKVAIGHSDPCRWSTDRGPSKTNPS